MATAPELDDPLARPVITRFTDYRAFLRAMIAHLKATTRHFSYRYFARVAGFSSPSFLKLVAEGKRRISPSSIDRFARGLGLDERERDVFETLVLLGQADSDDSRNRYFARLQRVSKGDPVVRMQADQYEAYSKWYILVIRELVALGRFRPEPGWIARRLRPRIRPEHARRALELLERVGLVKRRPDGQLETAETTLSTGPEVRSLAVRNFHREMLKRAISSIDGTPRSERNITALTVPLSRAQYDRVCLMVAELRRQILELAEESAPDEQAGEREVYQLSFPIFPLTQSADATKGRGRKS